MEKGTRNPDRIRSEQSLNRWKEAEDTYVSCGQEAALSEHGFTEPADVFINKLSNILVLSAEN